MPIYANMDVRANRVMRDVIPKRRLRLRFPMKVNVRRRRS